MQRSEKGDILVLVPCGKKKIWDKQPTTGPTPAKDAYRGGPFTLNRKYAEKFGDKWLVLSAKYGFIEPTFAIPANYNVTFKGTGIGSIPMSTLRQQLYEQRLDKFSTVIGLGGKDYRAVIEKAFQGTSVNLRFPFSGLGIMKSNRAISQAIKSSDPPGLDDDAKIHHEIMLTSQPRIAQASDGSGNVSDICQTLHDLFNRLPVFRFPFSSIDLPRNGIYVLFEDGEQAHGTNRIVRIGTHTGDGQLHSRLNEHFVKENKDRSIFRKNIGRCLLRQANDSFLGHWNIDLTSRVAKDAFGGQLDREKQRQVERNVSDYVRSRLRFVVFEVPNKDERLLLESRLIATVSLCEVCTPTGRWLGRHSPTPKIRESGLWQEHQLYKTPLTPDELSMLGDRLAL